MTEEIFVYPEGSTEFLFRLSMAALSNSGPFSLFPGIDRSLILLEGKPIKLNERVVSLLSPIHFHGEEKIEATIEAQGRDLNLMCRRGKASGKINVISGKDFFQGKSDFCFLFALTDSVKTGNLLLDKYDSCILTPKDEKTIINGEKFLRIDVSLF